LKVFISFSDVFFLPVLPFCFSRVANADFSSLDFYREYCSLNEVDSFPFHQIPRLLPFSPSYSLLHLFSLLRTLTVPTHFRQDHLFFLLHPPILLLPDAIVCTLSPLTGYLCPPAFVLPHTQLMTYFFLCMRHFPPSAPPRHRLHFLFRHFGMFPPLRDPPPPPCFGLLLDHSAFPVTVHCIFAA